MTKLGRIISFRQLFEKRVRRDCCYFANKRLSILCYIKSVCSLSILTCLAYSSPGFLVPYFLFMHFHVLHFCATFSSLAFSSRAVLCRIFHSCIFQPCIVLCAAFSCHAFSVAPLFTESILLFLACLNTATFDFCLIANFCRSYAGWLGGVTGIAYGTKQQSFRQAVSHVRASLTKHV